MNQSPVIQAALRDFSPAREFQRLFPNAEHTIVDSKRDCSPDGWKPVREWVSRAPLHKRYVIMMAVGIEISDDGAVSAIEDPKHYFMEVEEVQIRNGGPDDISGKVSIADFEDDGWAQLVQVEGVFAALEFEIRTDAPVDGFDKYWLKTSPSRHTAPADGIAFRAPYRFLT